MSVRARRAAALTASVLAAALLTPGAAQAAARPLSHPGNENVASRPSLSTQVTHATVTARSHGLTAALTPVSPRGSGLSIDLDASTSRTAVPGAHVTGYRFSFGDGRTATGDSSRAAHRYARPGTYTVAVTVTDSTGHSATVDSTIEIAGSDFTPVAPTRILDTRSGLGAAKAKLTTTTSVHIPITGVDGIPADATGVVLSLIAVDTVENGAVTCYPDATTEPGVSNLNFGGNQTIDNLITVPVPADGAIDCALSGDSGSSADLIGDLEGYYSSGSSSSYVAIQPGRILDTRTGLNTAKTKLANGHSLTLTVAGATATTSTSSTATTTETLPTSAITAVALNISTTDTSGNGVLTAFPDGSGSPTGNVLNYFSANTDSNPAVVPVGADGKIDISSIGTEASTTDVFADIEGYYTTGAGGAVYVPAAAITRILDTRSAAGGAVIAGDYRNLTGLTTADGVTAYVLNATITQPTANGNLCVFPTGSINPLDVAASNINYGNGETIAKFVQATAGSTGTSFFNDATSGSTQLLVDEFGYFTTQ
ncbi:PKD domain-containing protein [Actinospica durhamensis]|uniref:PKD domain-containing protein n=1 Tax=Actinospica durhamensis TaxID=1508375 RepID=A0A941EWU0_9ACTN|nr:PKD domain-containing protein [Actinospica durhamensis]MBR7836439.1 PKD domain-containing protein [Actinospica durhamensis]